MVRRKMRINYSFGPTVTLSVNVVVIFNEHAIVFSLTITSLCAYGVAVLVQVVKVENLRPGITVRAMRLKPGIDSDTIISRGYYEECRHR
ncbi:hypothetical protein HAX54_035552 [Datura stramonium]|uniref:Uncharacterized protein n=1 Tax=Datura stramonium TaxID=4076 RepID=A0ABS8SFP2_DATST|nr:hypothetical protein [Datura stramonium]